MFRKRVIRKVRYATIISTTVCCFLLIVSFTGVWWSVQAALATSRTQPSPQSDSNQTRLVEQSTENKSTENNAKKAKNRFSASLLSVPSGGIGVWVLQLRDRTLTVTVNAQTRLDDGVPALGSLLDVRIKRDAAGAWVASRIRSKKHEASQLVLRIADSASASAIANRYRLTLLNNDFAAAHLYLFTLIDEEAEEEEIANLMRSDPEIAWAELNAISQTPEANPNKTWLWAGTDPASYLSQDAFAQVNLLPSLASDTGIGVKVAVIDTGVALDHPALASHLTPGWDGLAFDSIPYDEGPGSGWGHGTHIAGIIARMAPDSKIMPIRVLDPNGRGNIYTLALGIEWAIQHEADVINLSLGAEQNSFALEYAIQHALSRGIIVVAASGNSNTSIIQYPAAYKDVIAVTSVDRTNVKAPFANFGSWVDLAAPGVGITSTMISDLGLGYASWSGTSISTAFVSGGAALLRQQMPDASNSKITSQMKNDGDDLNATNPAYKDLLGRLLNVDRMLRDGNKEISAASFEDNSVLKGLVSPLYLPVISQ